MTQAPNKPNLLKHLRASDLRALAQMATSATQGVANIAEGVHQAVLGTLGAEGTQQRDGAVRASGLTGWVYATVRGVTQLVGHGLSAALTPLEPTAQALLDKFNANTETMGADRASTPQREAVLAAINGVLGDQLQASANPLATPMTLRLGGQALALQPGAPNALARSALAGATAKPLIVIHGLCMNDLQWQNGDYNHASVLARALGYTPIFVRYNTGLHTSQNGQALSELLDALVAAWPVPIARMSVLVHSMGGLVIRSAAAHASPEAPSWLAHLKDIVFLGTPHHGAPLEQAGNWVDVVLGSTAFSKPFAKLAHLRSAGITDLRHGFVRPADWLGSDRFQRTTDPREPLPLPGGVACYTVAATTAGKRSKLSERTIGDGLVPLPSALGQSPVPAHCLQFPKAAQHIAFNTNHMQLLARAEIGEQIVAW